VIVSRRNPKPAVSKINTMRKLSVSDKTLPLRDSTNLQVRMGNPPTLFNSGNEMASDLKLLLWSILFQVISVIAIISEGVLIFGFMAILALIFGIIALVAFWKNKKETAKPYVLLLRTVISILLILISLFSIYLFAWLLAFA
jgi:hypothetical protein